MAAVDTNILIRLLVRDDLAQTALVTKLLSKTLAEQNTLFIPITVLLELDWVLRKSYQFDKTSRISVLNGLLNTIEFSIQSEAALESALHSFSHSNADFADCLHACLAQHAGEIPLWTLDQKAAKLNSAQLLF